MIRILNWVLLVAMAIGSASVQAATRLEIDSKVDAALIKLYQKSPAAKALIAASAGVLVFPEVYKGGFMIGGEYGEGALRIDGASVAYYSVASASIGFQMGAQRKSQAIVFVDPQALKAFQRSDGWEVGVDGSVALATLGAGGSLDSNTAKQPIVGFIFSNEGLMYNLTLEGSKMSRIER